MDRKNQETLQQCREILSQFPSGAEKLELLTGLLLICQAVSAFQRAYQAKEAAGEDLEDEGAYADRGVVFFPPDSRWESLKTLRGRELEAALAELLGNIRRQIPALRNTVRPELWKRRISPELLESLLEICDSWYGQSVSGPFDFAEILEGILSWFPYESAEKRFLAPGEVSQLLAELLRPEGGALYDPCCGSASLLAALGEDMTRRRRKFALYGHESDELAWRTAKVYLYLKGFPAKLGERPVNALTLGPDKQLQADVIIGNPPFNSKWRQGDDVEFDMDPRWRYGVPPKGNGNLAWLQHMLFTLKDPGVMSVVLNTSSLSSLNLSETRIRQGIVEDGLLEAIFLLPSGMFYGTNVPVSIWVLRKGSMRGQTLMLDARKLGVPSRERLVLDQAGRQRILDAWEEFRQGGTPAEPGFCASVGLHEIAEKGWTLDPRKYIDYPLPSLPSWEELERRDAGLSRELEELLAENRKIFRRIRQAWEGAGEHEPGPI